MNNILKYSFSKRQKAVLLAVAAVLVAAVYILFVHLPVKRAEESAALKREELSARLETARETEAEYLRMKAETERRKSLPEGEASPLPDYDNLGALMTLFDGIFRGTTPELRADSVKIENGIATRSVSFGFEAESFEKALEILGGLSEIGCRSQLRDLTVAAVDGGISSGAVRVSGSIVFYELAE